MNAIRDASLRTWTLQISKAEQAASSEARPSPLKPPPLNLANCIFTARFDLPSSPGQVSHPGVGREIRLRQSGSSGGSPEMRVRPGEEWSSLVDGLAGLASFVELRAFSCRIARFSSLIWPAAPVRPALADAPHLSPPVVPLRFLRSRSRVAAAEWLYNESPGRSELP